MRHHRVLTHFRNGRVGDGERPHYFVGASAFDKRLLRPLLGDVFDANMGQLCRAKASLLICQMTGTILLFALINERRGGPSIG